MKEQAYNIIKTKDSRTQRQSNLNKSKEARFKILPQESKDHTLGEIVSLKYVYEYRRSESTGYLLKETSLQERLFKPGYPQSIQDLMDVSIPNLRLQANPHIKSRLETLKGNFGVMHDMVFGSSISGFGWDPDKCVVTAPNNVWDAYAKTHPKATGLRDKPFIYYHKLSTIFGKDRAMGSRAVDLGEEEVVYEMEKTTPTNSEDIDIDMGVNLSPKIMGGKGNKRKRCKTNELIHIYSSSSNMLNNFINAIGNEMNINLSKTANDQERKLQCEIDLMKRVQKEIDALPGITFEEAFKVTDVIGVENHPPMLERSQYDSWQSRMLLYIRGKEHGIQLLESVKNGPFQFGTVEVPPTPNTPALTREQNLTDLIPEEKIHEVCDIRETNIILQGLPPDVYTLVNHHTIAKEIWDRVKLLIKGLKLLLQERESKMYNEFDRFTFEKGETIHSQNGGKATGTWVIKNTGNVTANQSKVIRYYNYKGEGHVAKQCTQPKRAHNSEWFKEKMLLAQAREARVILDAEQLIDDIHAFDSECDEAPTTSAVFMANLTSYDLNVLSESLKTQMDVLEKELSEKQDKYIEEIVDLEKKKKALDNIVYKTESILILLLIENDRLLEQIISQDIVCMAMHSYDDLVKYADMEKSFIDDYNKCLEVEAELLKKKDMVQK
ncbi:hypothetical protein Tco_1401170 [Tanacetum coccineum]